MVHGPGIAVVYLLLPTRDTSAAPTDLWSEPRRNRRPGSLLATGDREKRVYQTTARPDEFQEEMDVAL